MKLLNYYRPFLFLVPLLILLYAAVLAFPEELNRNRFLRFLDSLNERDMTELMQRNGFTEKSIRLFPFFRTGGSILFMLLLLPMKKSAADLIWILALAFLFFKGFYFFMKYKESARIKELNRILPYDIRVILYLSYLYPVINAFQKAKEYVHEVFVYDISQLIQDIDADPLSFGPYQKFLDRYDGKLDQLQFYLRILYRMSRSSAGQQKQLLANLNESLSANIAVVRSEKNRSINRTISYLGMIPVVLVSVMLTYLLIRFSNLI